MSSNSSMTMHVHSMSPTPHHQMSPNHGANMLKCKKSRNDFSKMCMASPLSAGSPSPAQPSVARRNERERNRVKMVNNGFAVLRQHVPNGAKNKKMSKVETLRSAVEYIRQLQKLLGTTGDGSDSLCYSTDDEQYQSMTLTGSASSDENSYPMDHLADMLPSPIDSSNSMVDAPHIVYNSSVPLSTTVASIYAHQQAMYMNNNEENISTGYLIPQAHLHHHNHQHQSTSPAPSIGSDLTTASSSSPFDANHHATMMDMNAVSHQQQLQQHHHQHHQHNSRSTGPSTTLATSAEDELFDFANWF